MKIFDKMISWRKLSTWFAIFSPQDDKKTQKDSLTIFPSFAYCSEDHSQINVNAGVYLIYCYAN